ncbi:MAG: MFS transporter, partial [Candidatus Colwellbacteria bacterium]|nr:MFS transporter [Candidatus Colwellbacteria bacterium]
MKGNIWDSIISNKVVRNFIICDLALFGGWGLVSPLMSIFIIERVNGATLVTVGAVATVYWVVRSLVEMPIAFIIEKTESENDDMYVLISGILLVSVSALWLRFVDTVPELFIYYVVHAIGFGLYSPAWSGIFSRHIDKNKAAFSWSLDHTVLGIATGITGLIGGWMAQRFGFNAIFLA